MRDIARMAGVSTATVSRILNDMSGQASKETVKRVMDAVAATGYVPNSMARSLRRRDPRALILLLPNIDNPFLTQVARGVEDVAQTEGFSVLLCNSDDQPQKERSYLQIAESGGASGVIAVPTTPHLDVSSLESLKVPVVAILRPLEGNASVDTILIDTFSASRNATRHLLSQGHRRIGCLAGTRNNYSDKQRLLGYQQAHQEAGVAVDESMVVFSETTVASGREAAVELMSRGSPTAILIANSLMAIGVIGAFSARQGDAAPRPEMIAFDDAPWIRELAPYLGVIRQPGYEFGRAAATMLLERLDKPEKAHATLIMATTLSLPGAEGIEPSCVG